MLRPEPLYLPHIFPADDEAVGFLVVKGAGIRPWHDEAFNVVELPQRLGNHCFRQREVEAGLHSTRVPKHSEAAGVSVRQAWLLGR